jgi:phosphate:Na+ symporter
MAILNPPTTLDLGVLVTQLGGGLALFLFGMQQMTASLKTVAGTGMKNLLARLTANRYTAALAGIIITAVIQSSSVTTVLVVGFVSAGLLNLSQSIGVILGANVGTTITAQIIAFKVYQYGLLLIAVGFFTGIAARREYLRQWGAALMGLGLIFFGMELMSIGTNPLRDWPPFIDLMQNIENPLLSIAIGAAFTAIVQSSSATTGIVIVLAGQGLISLETGIGLVLGSNIGTCITAFISAVGRPREAMQAAWAHVIFNVLGVLLWVFFIPHFADLVRMISPVSETAQGVSSAAGDTARQIANAHTIFNVTNLFLFIGFTGSLSRLVTRIVPERPQPAGVQPRYLDDIYLDQPALALDQVRRELARLGGRVRSMLGDSLHVTVDGTRDEVEHLKRQDNDVDTLYRACVRYLGKLSQEDLVLKQPQQLGDFIGIANYLENVGDVIERDLLGVARKRLSNGTTISPSTKAKLKPVEEKVVEAFDNVVTSLGTGDRDAAVNAMRAKEKVNDLAQEATAHLAKRLVADEPDRMEAFQIETEIIENYRRIYVYSRRIAKLCLKLHLDDFVRDD